MKQTLRRVAAWVGYPLFYFSCLFFFSYVTAPWERVKAAVTAGFNAGSPLRMEIGDLSWALQFPGIAAEDVKLVGTAPAPDASGKAHPAPEYVIDDLHARVSVLPLLWGTTKLAFWLDGFGGSIDGSVKTWSDGREMTLTLDDVDAAKLPYLGELLGIPLNGTLNGKVELKLPEQKLPKAEGSIELVIEDFEIGDGKAKIRDAIALPTVKAGTFTLKAELSEGTVKVTELSTKGPDLEVVADGRLRLMDQMNTSLADINCRFKFSDGYKNKDDVTRGIFGAPGSNVPGLFDLDPKMKRSKRDDGFYAWHVTGPLLRLAFNPAMSAGPEGPKSRRTPLRGFAKPKAEPTPGEAPAAPAEAPAEPGEGAAAE